MAKTPKVSRIPVGEKQELKDAVLVDVVESKEPWCEYQLSDGSVIKMKSLIMEVWRVQNEFDQAGEPVYVMKAGNIVNITASDDLKKKA